jgi:16S rRNA (cytidine1402-2'-O)-methyltransferase
MPDEASATPSHTVGGLVLVSTPIGNLGDMTVRGIEALRNAQLILCEDTRTTARLLSHYGIGAPTAALHEHNEDAATPRILERLRAGATIALVSDAGTPLISDPGFRLVRAAIGEGLPVNAMPGPSAVAMALTLSGLPPHPFLFLGFAPPREAARRAAFTRLRVAERAGLSATLLWYEAPHRLADMLADLAHVFGDRPAAVARELTKHFEEVRRAPLAQLAAHYAANEARGEITVVVGPAPDEAADETDLDALLTASLRVLTLREAATAVAETTGLPRRVVYARALELKADQ